MLTLPSLLALPSLPCLLASLLTGGITLHEKCTDLGLGFWRLETLRARRHGTCRTFFLKLLKICYTCKKTWTEQLFTLQCFVVLMYHTKLVTLWKSMRPEKSSSHKSRSLENLPPTLTALEQHIKEEPNGNLYNLWTTLPEAASSCSELIWGGYKNGCNVSRLPSSAQHCTSVLVTAINDHLATSIIDIKIYS